MTDLYEWRKTLTGDWHDLPSSARLTALVVSLHGPSDGSKCAPGAEVVAREAGLSLRTVRSSLSLLVDAGWLVLSRRGGRKGGKREPNEYRVAYPQGCKRYTREMGAPVQGPPSNGATVAPLLVSLGTDTEHPLPVTAPREAVAAVRASLAKNGHRS